ncbi:unnamed protein product [Dovyalis caffra]|uniref:Uncharacterized protein n=1 Tax=Dovyalis caffra TaxID=77055 RepID=A0AAV1RLQ4_9ROSI|nr:unnamed protein product [Dovyalis caffra]
MTSEMQKIKIDLPSLQAFNYTGILQDSCMDVSTSKNLEVLKLRSPFLTDSDFEDLISNLPFLRIRVKVSSQRLVKLKLITSLEVIIIDAPNLHTFKFAAITTPSVFSVDTSRLAKATCQLFEINASFFLKLRELVEYFKQYLKLQFEGDSHGDQNSEAEQLNFLMESLLKICHPEYLLILLYGCDESNFVSTAIMHKEKRHCCCTASRSNCWQLNINGIHYEQYFAAIGDSDILYIEQLVEPKYAYGLDLFLQ